MAGKTSGGSYRYARARLQSHPSIYSQQRRSSPRYNFHTGFSPFRCLFTSFRVNNFFANLKIVPIGYQKTRPGSPQSAQIAYHVAQRTMMIFHQMMDHHSCLTIQLLFSFYQQSNERDFLFENNFLLWRKLEIE